jgi:hypothetical protein
MSTEAELWAATLVNLKFDSTSGTPPSMTFPDDKGHIFTAAGATSLEPSPQKTGSLSAYLGVAGSFIQSESSADFRFGTGDYTLEAWVYFNSLASYSGIFDSLFLGGSGSRSNDSVFLVIPNGTIYLFQAGSSIVTSGSGFIQTGVWIHVAVSRNSGVTRCFKDGVQFGSSSSVVNNLTGSFLHIGVVSDLWGSPHTRFDGYIDDVRATKGIGRYVGTFTPPENLSGEVVPPPPPPPPPDEVFAEVLPFNPSINISEKFIWATSHIQTWTAEERTQLRDRPGYSVEYKINIRRDADLATLEDFYRVNQNLPVKVPMWSSPAYIENVALGATLIPLSNLNPVHPIRYFLEVGMDVIVWLSPTVWETHTVTAINAAGATLDTGLARAYTHCYFLVNLTGFISASAFSKSAGSRKTWSFTFTCPSVYIEEYPFSGSSDIFDLKPLISSEFTVISTQDSEVISSPLGLRSKIPLEGVTRRKWTTALKAVEFVDIVNLKRKLAYFRGKARGLRFPFKYLTPGVTPISVCLSEDSLSFIHSPKYHCSVTVGFEERITGEPDYVPFPNGFRYLTMYDWDTQLLGTYYPECNSPVTEGTNYPVDGHYVIAQPSEGIYLVIRATGNFNIFDRNGVSWKVGKVLSTLPTAQGTYLEPETSVGKSGLFLLYSNYIPEPW